jgi:hypothetical protein
MKRGTRKASKQPFGAFFQDVCTALVVFHSWDDPYGTFSPQYDSPGRALDALYKGYQEGNSPQATAKLVHKAWLDTARTSFNMSMRSAHKS